LAYGDYAQAQQAYADFARQYPEDGAAVRVAAVRDVLAALAAARDEADRLNDEMLHLREQAQETNRDLERLRRELGARAAELARARQELTERQAELTRQLAEVEALRADLEKLKSVDLRLERRR
jgi:chromosome segregation ATPase